MSDTDLTQAQPAPRDLEAMLEALIFVSKEPMSLDRIQEVFQAAELEIDNSDIRKALQSLMAKWDDPERSHGRGLILQKVAGGYLFTTASTHANVVKKMMAVKPLELTRAQIECLSIVAYRQPITRVDVDEIRGVDSSFAIKRLMQLKLLKILGKSEGLGRPLLYGTTRHFLEFFSLNSLNDLPTLKQFESLGRDEETGHVDETSGHVSIKDLFNENKNSSMFSHDVQRMSDEALKSLDEALLRIDGVEKNSQA